MKKRFLFLVSFSLLFTTLLTAANPSSGDAAASSSTVSFPNVIRFSGALPGNEAVAGVTFALYKDQTGGSPLWQEVQNVRPDATGHYTVLLGATSVDGLPSDLFSSTEARWLGVKLESGEELPRIQFVSVPYALHAADAETLGGLPVSAFMLNNTSTTKTAAAPTHEAIAKAFVAPTLTAAAPPPITANYVPLFFDSTGTLTNSLIFQGTNGVVGVNTASPSNTQNSKLHVNGNILLQGQTTHEVTMIGAASTGRLGQDVNGFFFSSDTAGKSVRFLTKTAGGVVSTPMWILPTGNVAIGSSTANNKLSVAGTIESTTGGFKFPDATVQTSAGLTQTSADGRYLQLSGGTLTGALTATAFTGNGSALTNVNAATLGGVAPGSYVTGVTAGTDLTGGGSGGTVTLNVDTTKVVTAVNVGTGITGGGIGGTPTVALDQTFTDGRYAKLSGGNTLVGNQIVTGTITASGNIASSGQVSGNSFNTAGLYKVNGVPIIFATTDHNVGNLFMGDQAGLVNNGGQLDLFDGAKSGFSNTTGSNNTFVGAASGEFNVDGNENTFLGFEAGGNNQHGNGNTYLGMNAGQFNTGSMNLYVGHNAGVGVLNEDHVMRLGSDSEIFDTYMSGVNGASVGGQAGDSSPIATNVAFIDANGKVGTVNSAASTTGVQIDGVFGKIVDGGSGIAVVVDSTGKLGTIISSRRFKQNIAPMGDTTEGLFKLRPVTFYYKPEVDKSAKRYTQYGLIAEEVAQVYPDLVVYDKDGQPYTVKYQYLTPMLLNEVQKQHAVIADQQSVIESQNQQIQNLEQRLERLEKLLDRSVATADTRLVSQP